jgi:hypothetical protein
MRDHILPVRCSSGKLTSVADYPSRQNSREKGERNSNRAWEAPDSRPYRDKQSERYNLIENPTNREREVESAENHSRILPRKAEGQSSEPGQKKRELKGFVWVFGLCRQLVELS